MRIFSDVISYIYGPREKLQFYPSREYIELEETQTTVLFF